MNPLSQSISTALVGFIWQGIVISCLLWAALFLLRKRSPVVRYFISCTAIATQGVVLNGNWSDCRCAHVRKDHE
jgi:hypothetical protein